MILRVGVEMKPRHRLRFAIGRANRGGPDRGRRMPATPLTTARKRTSP